MFLSVALLVVFFAVVHLSSCSTIITRGMIRSQTQSSETQDQAAQIDLPDPEKLTSTSANVHRKYQRIFPSFANEERKNFKRVLEDQDVLRNHAGHEDSHVADADAKQGDLNVDIVTEGKSNVVEERGAGGSEHVSEGNLPDDELGSSATTTTPSPQEISKMYWERFSNLSSDYFVKSHLQNLIPVSSGKGLSDGFWEVVQRLYTCTWAMGLMPCLQETFKVVSSETSFLQFLSPGLPKFELEDGQPNVNAGEVDKYDAEQDEGRKRTKMLQVFQTLQFLLPLLLAIKMSMLPALAVMVLVTGKAFFMSVLSLGAAIFSFFLQTPGLAANKRQEIAQQMPEPHVQDPSKYYYVM